MLDKIRFLAASMHAWLLGLTCTEHRVLGLGMVVLSVLCLVFPNIMAALIQLLGLTAAGAAWYVLWALKQRDEESDDGQ